MNTTKLNKNTKKAKAWVREYFKSSCFSVNNYYGRCSSAKQSIESRIKSRIYNDNLCDYRVLNGNKFYFTVGYRDEKGDILYVETFSSIYEIYLR